MTEVEKLVARAQQGDGQAVEEILTLYRDKVYSLAFGLAGNHADAEDRTALLLYALNEWSYREIATALNWSEAATKSRISRCRQRLKQKLVRAGFHHFKALRARIEKWNP